MKVLIIGLGKIGLIYDLNKKNMHLTHSKAFYRNKNFDGLKTKGYLNLGKISKIIKFQLKMMVNEGFE